MHTALPQVLWFLIYVYHLATLSQPEDCGRPHQYIVFWVLIAIFAVQAVLTVITVWISLIGELWQRVPAAAGAALGVNRNCGGRRRRRCHPSSATPVHSCTGPNPATAAARTGSAACKRPRPEASSWRSSGLTTPCNPPMHAGTPLEPSRRRWQPLVSEAFLVSVPAALGFMGYSVWALLQTDDSCWSTDRRTASHFIISGFSWEAMQP